MFWQPRLAEQMWPHLVLSVVLLTFDYLSGSAIEFPITFVLPVASAAWFCRSRLGYFLSVAMPIFRASFVLLWGSRIAPLPLFTNTLIRMAVLLLIAYLARRTARLGREVKVLEGIIPVCCFCKNIRDQQDRWLTMENYIGQRTDADFSHGICPTCADLHHGHVLSKPQVE